MADPDPALRGRQSLWTIWWLHVVVSVAFMALAFVLLERQKHRNADKAATQTAYAQKMAVISGEKDIQSLRQMALSAWQQSDKDWKLIDSTWDTLTVGFTCLPALSLATAFIAWRGLRRRKIAP